MGRKKNFGFSQDDLEPVTETANTGKLPIDSTGAGRALANFQDIPVAMLHPFSLKDGEDYSRHDAVLSEQFVESIKKYGVLETLIVRKSRQEMSMYEIIAGESRWAHAKKAGEQTVPCRVMELDDDAARNIFHLTNLMRRELTPRDKVHGWYAFYVRLRDQAKDQIDVDAALSEKQASVAAMVGGKEMTLRTIQRYVKMHDLIEPWLDKLDSGEISGRIGYQIAFLPPEVQEQLLTYKVTEAKAAWLRKVYVGEDKQVSWHEDIIQENFEKLPDPKAVEPVVPTVALTKEEKEARRQTRKLNNRFKKALPGITIAIREKLRPEDYEHADDIISRALDLYYQQNTTAQQ